jgi:hypothetical protein
MSTTHERTISPFACDMTAIALERDQHIATTKELFRAVEAIRELPDGYAFRFPGERTILALAAAFVALERRCCPFFGFTIEVEPEGGPFWLHLTGREGVKPFIQAELGEVLDESLARAAGFRADDVQ